MSLLRKLSVLLALLTLASCFENGSLPPATSGNTPGGSVPEDEPPISSSVYIQSETRSLIEYKGSSN